MSGSDQPIVLAGDIGGTKTNLGLFARGEDRPAMLVMESYSSAHASGLSELITRFLEAHPQSVFCCVLGITGPVIDGRCRPRTFPGRYPRLK
jgi:glucokinase